MPRSNNLKLESDGMRKVVSVALMAAVTVFCGCELLDDDDDSSSSSIDLGSVSWLHTNVSGWSQTASLSGVAVSGNTITLNYDRANTWPGASTSGGSGLNANAWVFVNLNGQWYAGTWEWMRTGQTTKFKRAVNGDHIGVAPLSSWSPVSGETYGFMVSGLARGSARNVQERSNVVMYTWP